MRRKAGIAIVTVTAVLAMVSGYAWADAHGHVPGVLTTEPAELPPAPFLAHAPVNAAVSTDQFWPVGVDAPLPAASAVQELAQELRADPRTGSSTNVAVVDVLTGDVLADVDGGATQVPASTTKTLTAVAALAALGPDFTTRTTVTHADGRLTLIAGGDMMLAAGMGHGGERDEANGWAGMGDLAAQVVQALGAETDVEVVVDDAEFPGPLINAEWPSYAVRRGYVAGVSGLAVDIARVEDELYAQRHRDPSLSAGDDFARALTKAGLDVTDVRRGTNPGSATEVATVESAPLSLVVEHLIHQSDNTIAENLGRVLARETDRPATPTGAAEATIATLDELGVDTEGLLLYDSAGFSIRNRISPFHLTQTMRAALADPGARGLLDYLPVAGAEGTVEERFEGTDVAGVMRAKTGSLTGVTSLAGIISTAEGRLLTFAILADGMPYGQDRPRDAFDDFLLALTQCGCDE